MSLLDQLERMGSGTAAWNYTKPNEPDYCLSKEGTVVEIRTPQATDFSTGAPKFDKNGRPQFDIQLIFVDTAGDEWSWYCKPLSNNPGFKALTTMLNGNKIRQSLGMVLRFTTQQPPQGFNYGQGNPRPWTVEYLGQGDMSLVRGVNDDEKEMMMQANQQQVQAQQPQVQVPGISTPAPASPAVQQLQQAIANSPANPQYQQPQVIEPPLYDGPVQAW